MRFLQKNKKKDGVILVISDLHLGAGTFVKGKRNPLEDFHHDKELVDFLNFYCSDEYHNAKVELIINGDFLDFLAVPYINYFDDEYWSEKAAKEKFELIYQAHTEVFEALENFISKKNKKVVYIIGNHDAELILPQVQKLLLSKFNPQLVDRFTITSQLEYHVIPGLLIKHGHDYERAHSFDVQESIITSAIGERYFLPPWGSYYVTRVINKYKEERGFINQIRPIKSFLIWGLIFDTLFTIRFIFANAYYFFMVKFLFLFKQKGSFKELLRYTVEELELFHDMDSIVSDFFKHNPTINTLIVGHTHGPINKKYPEDKTFINTGTWTKMFNLDFGSRQEGFKLTFAQIDLFEKEGEVSFEPNLFMWEGKTDLPYQEVS